ncbi:uncharacterized protein LOC132701408 [Cylas formicarius]|uniref:uncharacterized protein LOC132701408 n=1 Tax=Cylas formicarius TaxID=197179 RepID=UPI0029585A74|nr:uncharacterized protein LOC132701408 [Cylas formicarius]
MGSFYQRMTMEFGPAVARALKTVTNTNIRLAHQRNRRVFLLECRRLHLTPRFLEDSTQHFWKIPQRLNHNNTSQIEFLTQKVTHKLHNITIYDTCRAIKMLESRLSWAVDFLRCNIPFRVLDEFLYTQNIKYDTLFNKIKKSNLRKLKSRKANSSDLYTTDNSNWFKNVSNIEIPDDVRGFLSLGPKFSLPVSPQHIDIFKLLSEVEITIQNSDEQKRDLLRTRATNLITNYINSSVVTSVAPPTYDIERRTKRFLKANPNLVITKSDKGNVTVAMTKEDYLEKSLILLNDANTYLPVIRDPTHSIETQCNNIIKKINNLGYIDDTTARNLKTYNGVCPKYYGLPKIHKDGYPLRPIVSCVGASTQPLAKFISQILYKSFSSFNKFRVKDSFEFAERINESILPSDFSLVSFDVVSLFTHIPLQLVVDIIEEHFDLVEPNCTLSKKEFLDTVTFLYNNTFFSFDGKFYQQVKGLPMGGAASPVIAEIVRNKLLYYVIDRVSFEFPFIYQYLGTKDNLTKGRSKVPLAVCTCTTRISLSVLGYKRVMRPRSHFNGGRFSSLIKTN